MIIKNKKIWSLIEKLYIHCFSTDDFVAFLKNYNIDLPSNFYDGFEVYTFMNTDNLQIRDIMLRTSTYKYQNIVKSIIFEDRIIATQHDNWNYLGEYIKHWYPELIKLLGESGFIINQINKTIKHADEESKEQGDIEITGEDFIKFNFNEPILENLRRETNECFQDEKFLAAIFLSRKLAEVIITRIMEVVFPKIGTNGVYNEDNHDLWFDREWGRNLFFEKLLNNLMENSNLFIDDKNLILQICDRLKIFKTFANNAVHRDYVHPDTMEEIQNTNIDKTFNLIGKIYRKYCNP